MDFATRRSVGTAEPQSSWRVAVSVRVSADSSLIASSASPDSFVPARDPSRSSSAEPGIGWGSSAALGSGAGDSGRGLLIDFLRLAGAAFFGAGGGALANCSSSSSSGPALLPPPDRRAVPDDFDFVEAWSISAAGCEGNAADLARREPVDEAVWH